MRKQKLQKRQRTKVSQQLIYICFNIPRKTSRGDFLPSFRVLSTLCDTTTLLLWLDSWAGTRKRAWGTRKVKTPYHFTATSGQENNRKIIMRKMGARNKRVEGERRLKFITARAACQAYECLWQAPSNVRVNKSSAAPSSSTRQLKGSRRAEASHSHFSDRIHYHCVRVCVCY